MEGSFV